MSARILPPSHLIGPYVVEGLLGRTGWATTYAVRTSSGGHRALKVLDSIVADTPGVLATLESALVAVAALGDEHVLQPVDAGEDEAYAPFVVSRLSPHPSLAELVAVSALGVADVVRVLAQLGGVLEEARKVGVAHLALKPSNVFVGPPPEYRVLLADFGMGGLRRAYMSVAGDVESTWLAPEQLSDQVVDPFRADVYLACLLARFALTGDSSINPSNEAVTAAIERGLAMDPIDRFATVSTLVNALAASTDHSSVAHDEAAARHARASGRLAPCVVAASESEVGPTQEDADAGARVTVPGSPAGNAVEASTMPPPAPSSAAAAAAPSRVGRTTRMVPFKLPSANQPSTNRPNDAPTVRPPRNGSPGGLPRFDPSHLPLAEPAPKPIDRTLRLAPYQMPPSSAAAIVGPRPPEPAHEAATARRPRFVLGGIAPVVELVRRYSLVVVVCLVSVALALGVVSVLHSWRK